MFSNYLITGLRAQLKEKGYAMIKIAGLVFGLATTIIICLFVVEDLSYDKFHTNWPVMSTRVPWYPRGQVVMKRDRDWASVLSEVSTRLHAVLDY